jgi:hypothetical protein
MISLCREESYKFKVFSLYIGKSLIGHFITSVGHLYRKNGYVHE